MARLTVLLPLLAGLVRPEATAAHRWLRRIGTLVVTIIFLVGQPARSQQPQPSREHVPDTLAGFKADPRVPDGAARVYPADSLDTKLFVLRCERIIYPENLRRANVEGDVLVDVVVDAHGVPEKNNVWVETATNGAFGKEALAFAQTCRFSPPTVHQKPVRARLYMPVRFRVK